jgi:putative endopeptidase
MDAALRQQVLTNPHSPGFFRANGPITNTEEFYKAFDITSKDPMYVAPEKRAKIW